MHWLPNHYWIEFVGFDLDGSYSWNRTVGSELSKELGFLFSDDQGGVVAGGSPSWLAELSADGEVQQIELPDLPQGVLKTGVLDGEGIVVSGGGKMVRLDSAYGIDWTRSYKPFDEESAGGLIRTNDRGYLFWTGASSGGDVRLGKTSPSGELQWSHPYHLDTNRDARLHTFAESSPGEYILAGGYHLSSDGWALHLSTEQSLTPTDTTELTGRRSTTDQTTSTTDQATSTSTTPGFGFVTGGLAIGAGLLARLLRENGER